MVEIPDVFQEFILIPSDEMTKEVQMLAENNWKLARQQVKDILG